MSREHAQAKRRLQSSAEFSELVAQYPTSGLAQREFCRRHGLALSRLRRRLLRRPRKAAQGGFAADWITVELSPSRELSEWASASSVVLAVGSYRVELARGFDGQTLRQLPTVLAGRRAVFVWGGGARIYPAEGSTRLPTGFDGLYARVCERVQMKPLKRARVHVRQPGAHAAADSVLGWLGVVAGDEAAGAGQVSLAGGR